MIICRGEKKIPCVVVQLLSGGMFGRVCMMSVSAGCQEVLSSLAWLAWCVSVVTGFPQRQTPSLIQGHTSDLKTIPLTKRDGESEHIERRRTDDK